MKNKTWGSLWQETTDANNLYRKDHRTKLLEKQLEVSITAHLNDGLT